MPSAPDLAVFSKAHELTLSLYAATSRFPGDERFGLTSQLRRAAGSIGANISEGRARSSQRDFGRFLDMAHGSTAEVEYHLLLAKDLGYIDRDQHEQLERDTQEVGRMLASLRATVLGRA